MKYRIKYRWQHVPNPLFSKDKTPLYTDYPLFSNPPAPPHPTSTPTSALKITVGQRSLTIAKAIVTTEKP